MNAEVSLMVQVVFHLSSNGLGIRTHANKKQALLLIMRQGLRQTVGYRNPQKAPASIA